jgi:UDP-glucuronate decarboxylase
MQIEDGRVVSNFIVQALKNEPLTIYGDGEQTRSFCYYTDLLRGLKLLMESEQSFDSPINLGNPEEFTMLQLAQLIIDITSSKSRLQFQPLPSDDPKQRKPSIERAYEKLGWSPSINLEEGLKLTIRDLETRI